MGQYFPIGDCPCWYIFYINKFLNPHSAFLPLNDGMIKSQIIVN